MKQIKTVLALHLDKLKNLLVKKKFILDYFLRLNISETKIYNFIKKKN